MSIEKLRKMYADKVCTPEEVITEIIARSNADAQMNIWITPPSLDIIQPYLDQLKKKDPVNAPLWGIPFAIKDNIDMAGVPTTAGCPDYAYIPKTHATVVERLVEAGAIPIGKTNLDQFATGLVGVRSPYGETHNALRPELISGGSSSGSAVAVARGHAAFSLGTDTAGSGRVPAALNNIVGYKPSLGAWPVKGVVPACESLDCVTAFTQTLEDAIMVDTIARGLDENDQWSKHIPFPAPVLPKKICLPKEPIHFFGPYAATYKKAWEDSIDKIEALNIPIEYIDSQLFSEIAAILYDGPWVAERWSEIGSFIESHPPNTVFPITENVLRLGSGSNYNASSVFEAMHKIQAARHQTRKRLEDAVLIMPTVGGTWTREQVREDPIETNSKLGNYTNHCNLLDLSAVALPSGFAEENTPFGITLFARSDSESLIYGLGELYVNQVQHFHKNELNHIKTVLVSVCGLHMRGYPLEKQMYECGATFIREDVTAPTYQMIMLPTDPQKPGLIKKQNGGASIHLEIWEMPIESLGSFVTSIPSPLGFGKIELQNGEEVSGFICEAFAAEFSEDITELGSWRNLVVHGDR